MSKPMAIPLDPVERTIVSAHSLPSLRATRQKPESQVLYHHRQWRIFVLAMIAEE